MSSEDLSQYLSDTLDSLTGAAMGPTRVHGSTLQTAVMGMPSSTRGTDLQNSLDAIKNRLGVFNKKPNFQLSGNLENINPNLPFSQSEDRAPANELQMFLQQHDLSSAYDFLVQQGVEKPVDIAELKEQDLNLPPIQKRRLLKLILKLTRENMNVWSTSSDASSGGDGNLTARANPFNSAFFEFSGIDVSHSHLNVNSPENATIETPCLQFNSPENVGVGPKNETVVTKSTEQTANVLNDAFNEERASQIATDEAFDFLDPEKNSSQAVLTNGAALQIDGSLPVEFVSVSGGGAVGNVFQRQQKFATASDFCGESALPCEGAPAVIQRMPSVPAFGRAGLDPGSKLQVVGTSPNTGNAEKQSIIPNAASQDVIFSRRGIEDEVGTDLEAATTDIEDADQDDESDDEDAQQFGGVMLESHLHADTSSWVGTLLDSVPSLSIGDAVRVVNASLGTIDLAVKAQVNANELCFQADIADRKTAKVSARQEAARTHSAIQQLKTVNGNLLEEKLQIHNMLQDANLDLGSLRDRCRVLNTKVVEQQGIMRAMSTEQSGLADDERNLLLQQVSDMATERDTAKACAATAMEQMELNLPTKDEPSTATKPINLGGGHSSISSLQGMMSTSFSSEAFAALSKYDQGKAKIRAFYRKRAEIKAMSAKLSHTSNESTRKAIDEIGTDSQTYYKEFQMSENMANGLKRSEDRETMDLLVFLDPTVINKSPKAIHDHIPMSKMVNIDDKTEALAIAKFVSRYIRDNLSSMYPIASDIFDIEESHDGATGLFKKPRHCKENGYCSIVDDEERQNYDMASKAFFYELTNSLAHQSSRLTTAQTAVQYGGGKFETTCTAEDGVQLFFALLCTLLKDVVDVKQVMIKELTVCAAVMFERHDPQEVVEQLSDKVTEAMNMSVGRPKITYEQCIGNIALALVFRVGNLILI